MKRKKMYFALIVVILSICGTINFGLSLDKNKAMPIYLLDNIDALAGEQFVFNNKTWDTYYHDYNFIGKNWTPHLHPCGGQCFIISGAVTCDGVTVSGSYGNGSFYEGKKITCKLGFGNCWDGTPCIPN